jgi:hypothetical protein
MENLWRQIKEKKIKVISVDELKQVEQLIEETKERCHDSEDFEFEE